MKEYLENKGRLSEIVRVDTDLFELVDDEASVERFKRMFERVQYFVGIQ